MLRGRLDRRSIILEEHLGDLPLVAGSAAQLNQVFLNLLVNAMQAIESTHRDDGLIAITTETQDGEIIVQVADNGCGIPEEILPQIFDPFFTTKGVGDGTGLGLSITHGMVQDHGGRLEVESVHGQAPASASSYRWPGSGADCPWNQCATADTMGSIGSFGQAPQHDVRLGHWAGRRKFRGEREMPSSKGTRTMIKFRGERKEWKLSRIRVPNTAEFLPLKSALDENERNKLDLLAAAMKAFGDAVDAHPDSDKKGIRPDDLYDNALDGAKIRERWEIAFGGKEEGRDLFGLVAWLYFFDDHKSIWFAKAPDTQGLGKRGWTYVREGRRDPSSLVGVAASRNLDPVRNVAEGERQWSSPIRELFHRRMPWGPPRRRPRLIDQISHQSTQMRGVR